MTVLIEKTRIAFHAGRAFLAVTVRPAALCGHLILPEKRRHPRFRRIATLASRQHAHHFRLTNPGEIDPEFVNSIREAYAVGQRRPRR
jgi:hypothetical protein